MSGGRLILWLWWAASLGSPRRPAAEGTRDGCSARAVDCVTGPSRRALCLTSLSHRQNRLACHSSYGARGREVQGILEGSVGATGRPSRLETTTFGEGGKNVTARRHTQSYLETGFTQQSAAAPTAPVVEPRTRRRTPASRWSRSCRGAVFACFCKNSFSFLACAFSLARI